LEVKMWTVVVHAGGGWDAAVMTKLLEIDAVLRVDGIGLRADGKFSQAAVHLGSQADAHRFARVIAQVIPGSSVVQG